MDISLPVDWPLLGVLEAVWVVGVVISILLQDRTPIATLAWIFGLALLPGVGFFVYLVFGPRRLARKRVRRALARTLVQSREGLAWVRESRKATAEGAVKGELGPSLAELAVQCGEPPPWHCEEVTLLLRGCDVYTAMIDAIRAARHHVHLEYYIFAEGVVASRILDALVAKAKEGVEVRLLVDGLGSAALSSAYLAPLVAAGGEVAIFNRVAIASLRRMLLNFRTHRKILCVDGRIGFTGGTNVEDGHDETVVGACAWRDTNVRVVGDAVAALELVFLEDWTYATGHAPAGGGYLSTPTGAGDLRAQIVASGPDPDAQFAIYKQYFAAVSMARERVYLTSAYFVPDEPFLMALTTAAKRGVDVRVLVPARSDHAFVDAAARAFFPALLESGVRLYGYERAVIHAKTLVVDHEYAVVGTANADTRSFKLNFELIAAFFDRPVVDALASAFEADLEHARPITRLAMKREPIRERVVTSIAKLFAPIL